MSLNCCETHLKTQARALKVRRISVETRASVTTEHRIPREINDTVSECSRECNDEALTMAFLLELRVNGGVVLSPTAHTSPFYPKERRGRENGRRGGLIGGGIKKRAKKVRV
jgi:hypothetical protein